MSGCSWLPLSSGGRAPAPSTADLWTTDRTSGRLWTIERAWHTRWVAAMLLYDADCGFCTRAARWLAERECAVEIIPLQGADLDTVGVDRLAALERIHLVDGSRVQTGHTAIVTTLASSRRPGVHLVGRLVGLVPNRAAAAAYDWTARHRHRLPGGSTSCRLS